MRGRLTPARAAGALALVAVLTAVTLPVLQALGTPSHRVELRPVGHWVYHHALKAAYHVHGGAREVDARIALPGLRQGGPVVQGDTHGYVLDGPAIVGFGTSTLTVDATTSTGTAEQPVPLEVPGGPYLLYPRSGTVLRLGTPPERVPATTPPPHGMQVGRITVGGPVNSAVAADDGTVWVHRRDTGQLCSLARAELLFHCVGPAPAGPNGALTALGRHVGFLDTGTGMLSVLHRHGLRPAVRVLPALPAGGAVAAADSAGRLAVLDPHGAVLHLADTSWVGTARRTVAEAVAVRLDPGRYDRPVPVGSAVALLDLTGSRLLTVGHDGLRRGAVPVPAPVDAARVTRGADGKVYVDDATGAHTLVVDGDGSVTDVPIGGPDVPTTVAVGRPGPPVPPPLPHPSAAHRPAASGPAPVTPLRGAGPPGGARGQVARPGSPAPVAARPGNQRVLVSWRAAAGNGGSIGSYQLSWTPVGTAGAGGSRTVPGNRLTTSVAGLRNGTMYVFRVAARNTAGTGPAAASLPVTPSADAPPPPGAVTASAAPDGTVTVSWAAAAGGPGSRITGYAVAAGGDDGTSAVVAYPTATAVTLSGANGLTLGVGYTFAVTATNDKGLVSAVSAPSNRVVPYAAADPPVGLTAQPADGAVELSWAAATLNGGDLIGYLVTGDGLPTRMVAGRFTRYPGLVNGRQYRFSVRAVTRGRNAADGPPVTGAAASTAAIPVTVPVVSLDSVLASGDRQVTVRVTVDGRGSGVVVCELFFNGSPRWRGGCAGTQEITVGGLDHGTNYDVYVQAENAHGPGNGSGHRAVRTNEAPALTGSRGGRHTADDCAGAGCAWIDHRWAAGRAGDHPAGRAGDEPRDRNPEREPRSHDARRRLRATRPEHPAGRPGQAGTRTTRRRLPVHRGTPAHRGRPRPGQDDAGPLPGP